uniref:Coenzyme Q-binding protein COQ10 START domain-containing protein n=1 Tax=Sphenodon punctatus TaxID=8508 RepID=A0A8D0GMI0_SPHPU
MAGTSRKGAVFLRALLETGARPSRGDGTRHLSSCGILATRTLRPHHPLTPVPASKQAVRPFLHLAAPLLGSKRMEYSETRVLGYSAEQMYAVVSDVGSYRLFVPWCTSSRVLSCHKGLARAELEVGFPPLVEHYVSEISMVPQHQIRAVCSDGRIFSHLETLWRFEPGLPMQPDTCTLDFSISFEFKSLLHSQLATLFFDEVVKQTVSAFECRAKTMYGPRAVQRLQAAHST